jgi:hypothetical protein
MDLSEERVKVWSNSKPRYFQVHAQGAEFTEVTEGFRPPFGRVWERSRYEWEPGSIRQTVIDSNVLAPDSTWELKISPSGGGSTVEMRLRREFRRMPRAGSPPRSTISGADACGAGTCGKPSPRWRTARLRRKSDPAKTPGTRRSVTGR